MQIVQEIKKSLLTSIWFAFLTFPILVIKVDPLEKIVAWRWGNLGYIALATFVISLGIRGFILESEKRKRRGDAGKAQGNYIQLLHRKIGEDPFYLWLCCGVAIGVALIFPHLFSGKQSTYQLTIMTSALMYIVLGLGLNIVVGLAGLLDLGFVAFYAVGAYTYALLNAHFQIGFWSALPLCGMLAAVFGILLGFPVLRLRGDYLAIVTLGFGEIIRLVLENWGQFTRGPSGITPIDQPALFGLSLTLNETLIYIYYIMVAFVVVTIFIVNRLQDSRLGRAWIALREDEIACQAMGINKRKTKLAAFSLGAFWAGIVGAVFAAKTNIVTPNSFTFSESVIILCIVVLGGMGSIVGVIIGALFLILLPEYLRFVSEYRMLIFSAILVIMMIFRPQGLIANVRRTYKRKKV